MSYWNHRVIHKYHDKTDSHTYQIHEVYYDDKGTIEGWTESAMEPFGETPSELPEGYGVGPRQVIDIVKKMS